MKECKKCKKYLNEESFYRRGSTKRQSYCKKCSNELKKKKYKQNKGMWIYVITLDGIPRWVGSTINLEERLKKHESCNRRSNFSYEARKRGINLKNHCIEVYVCDIVEHGFIFTQEDLEYYEHFFIRVINFKHNYLFNVRDKSKYIERDRYIDEVPIGGFRFIKLERQYRVS